MTTVTRKHPLACLLSATVGLLAGAAPAWAEEATLPLSDLIHDSDKALLVLEADAAAEAARQDVNRERAESGLRMTLGGGYGIVRNIVDVNKAFTYDAAQAQAGFSYPLLGAAEQSDRRIDAALGKQHEQQIRADAARALAQLELESAYAQYWGAQESLKVVQAYLSSEDLVLPKLQLRAQHKLLLQSGQLDAEAAYAQAHGDLVRFRRAEDEARSRLERLTGRQLGAFAAGGVSLPAAPQVQIDSLLLHHPDIAALRAQRDALQAQLNDSTWYGIEASLDVTAAGVKDLSKNGGPYGGDTFVGLNFKAPVGVFSARSAQKKSLRAQMEGLRLRIQDRSQELGGEVRSAEQQLAQSQSDDEQMSRRVQASSESLRESYLRGGIVADEGVDVLAHRLQGYYSAALEQIDGRVKGWRANIALRGYAIADEALPPQALDAPSDLGAQLADPIIQVDQMLQGHAANLPSPLPTPMTAPPAAAPRPAAAVQFNVAPAPAMTAQEPPPAAGVPAAAAHLEAAVYTVPPRSIPQPATSQPFTSQQAMPQQATSQPVIPQQAIPQQAVPPPAMPQPAVAHLAAAPTAAPQLVASQQAVAQPVVLRQAGVAATAADAAPSRPALQLASTLSAAAPSPGEPAAPAMGVYVWNSAELIAAQQDERRWQELQQVPVNRVLLALNARQIAEAQTQPQALRGFLDAARRHGIAVELLLGEPSWIEPAQRPKLVAIINSLRGFDFAGLNLDIEPDQIYKQPLDQAQFDNWMETLRSAARASPWPTAATMHPRYFRDPPYMSWNVEQRLREAGIGQVVLMIFNSSPQRVADIARPIVGSPRAAGLRFRVAQSVEPELEPQLSYARRSPQDFQQSMQQLQGLLAAQPNTDGIVVQAWNDLQRMGHESQIR